MEINYLGLDGFSALSNVDQLKSDLSSDKEHNESDNHVSFFKKMFG